MTAPVLTSWQAVADEVLARIRRRDWAPGDLIPNEVDLAGEMGCARTTVNRALRHLAEAGYLERRRKAGTRVALMLNCTSCFCKYSCLSYDLSRLM